MPLNYVGYIEGRDINAGNVDIAVTDGFTGNAILKSLEGLGSFVQFLLRQMFERNLKTKLAYLMLRKDLQRIRDTLDYDAVGGAPLLGVNGVTIIAHGSSSPKAIKNAIRVAAESAHKEPHRADLRRASSRSRDAGVAWHGARSRRSLLAATEGALPARWQGRSQRRRAR